MAINCSPGGRFEVPVEFDLPKGVSALSADYSWYAEYTGPVEDVGVGNNVIRTDESAARPAAGKTTVLEGSVPAGSPPGVYNLSHSEQRFDTQAGVVRHVVPIESIADVAELVVEAPPASPSVVWPTIERVG